MKLLLKILLPLIVLAAAAWGAHTIIKSKPEVKTQLPEVLPPLVRIEMAEKQTLTLIVSSQGTVSPRTESRLVPEVSGRVIEISPSFVPGGFFEDGEVLLKIDPHDYNQALIRARAEVAARKLRLAQEEAEAEVARSEWQDLNGDQTASPLTLREPFLEDARAALASAQAMLKQAERDLDRTKVKAHFAGRVREKLVDLGQYVGPTSMAATIYAVDSAEIRLPLPDRDLAFLDLPLDYRGDRSKKAGPRVWLQADFAGYKFRWEGRICRTEGEIDPASRMVHVVAQVENPYGRGEDPDRPPLAVGMYVQAEIEGRSMQDVVVLPREALRGKDRVLVVDDDNRLHFRTVTVLRTTREEVVIRDGLEHGERVCLSPLEAVTDGMRVRLVDNGSDLQQDGEGQGES